MSRAQRLLSRALLAAGGALAGTAAAWALSTTAASAQPADHDVIGVVGVVVRAVDAAPEVVAPVGATVRDLDAALHAHRAVDATPPDLGHHVAGGLRDAVALGLPELDLADLRPIELHPVATHPVATSPAGPVRATSPVARPAGEAPAQPTGTAAVAPLPAGPVAADPFGEFRQTWAPAPAQPLDAPGDDAQRSQPGDPAAPPLAPLAPPGVPAHCACGGDGPGSANGGSGPSTGVSTDHHTSAVARAVVPPTGRNSVMPGKQPGITPD
ncbi:hypothetical protein [Saccharothrix obliqua]|uniref:hypothetical protein n=1 Tax=Saccharothrix obliqua TaxID=2861747 RepID=UPI001C5E0B79|nr:hypothetical protein [Saccharothrix obliqua]MBW4719418.1 hypothetical protein [Saccharothrix obliqua]